MMNDGGGTRIAIGTDGKVTGEADGGGTRGGRDPIMRDPSPNRTTIALARARIMTEGPAKAAMARAMAVGDSSVNIIATAVTAGDMAVKLGAGAAREKAKAGRPAATTAGIAAA